MPTRTFGPYQVELSNLDKVLFPESGITKRDLIAYYERIAERMLPHLEGRPLTMHRFPDGIGEHGFYQKEIGSYFPEWVERIEVANRGEGSTTYVVCGNKATLVYLANQACITPHVWLSRRDDLDRPDQMVFDLDPAGEEPDLGVLRRAALRLRERLESAGMTPFVKTSGSRGYHLHVPLDGGEAFDAVRAAARAHADAVAEAHDDELTTAQRKAKRRGRLFIDVGRNAPGQTTVCPFAVRARPGAPVAVPIAWSELEREAVDPRRYHVGNVFRCLAQVEDPWAAFGRHAASAGGGATS